MDDLHKLVVYVEFLSRHRWESFKSPINVKHVYMYMLYRGHGGLHCSKYLGTLSLCKSAPFTSYGRLEHTWYARCF